MAAGGFGRAQKATALVPLAVLSVAWTASLATTSSDAASPGTGRLPDGSQMPSQTVRAPASLSKPGRLAPGMRRGFATTASASGIPAVALAAYQRAQTVMNAADPSCHLPWQLVAAIGRVESDHGRTEGNVLTARGVARPGIFGPELDGRHGTTLIKDTDAGQYDGDARFDRAVGPMQFIPSTWAIVGVDADNDGQRNPQDINDAALASAVYLCSGTDDLATTAGQRAAVYRYNHSQSYVALVLAITHAYLRGDFSSVPNVTTSTGFTFATPTTAAALGGHHPRRHHLTHHRHAGRHGHHTPTSTSPTPTSGPTAGPTTGPTSTPTANPTSNPTGHLPVSVPTSLPTTLPTTLPPVLSHAEAVAQCLAQGLVDNPLDPNDAFDQCVYKLTH